METMSGSSNNPRSLERYPRHTARGTKTNTIVAQDASLQSMRQDTLQRAGIPDLTKNMHISNELLGEGSFADVYSGHWDGIPVAVKVGRNLGSRPISEKSNDWDALEEEVQAMSMIRHPFIVQYWGTVILPRAVIAGLDIQSEDPETLYVPGIVMERLKTTLQRRYAVAPALRHDEQVQIARHVSSALSFLHCRHILHRNVEPSNILLSAVPTGQTCECSGGSGEHHCRTFWAAKLGDFGTSSFIAIGAHSAEMAASTLDDVYTAPEVMLRTERRGDRPRAMYGSHADVYALGASMLAMCVRYRPAARPSWVERFNRELEDLGQHPLAQIISDCVRYEPDARCTARHLMEHLIKLEDESSRHSHSPHAIAHGGVFRQLATGEHGAGETWSDVNEQVSDTVATLEQNVEELQRKVLRRDGQLEVAGKRLIKPFLKAHVSVVGKLPPQVSLASGTPCIHHGYIYRSALWKVADSRQTVLLRAPVGNPSPASWERFPLPEHGSGTWTSRVHTHSFGDYLYCIVTRCVKRTSSSSIQARKSPRPEIWSFNTQCQSPTRWQLVIRFRHERYNFGSALIRNWVVVAGGHEREGQPTPTRQPANSVECVELTCGDGQAKDWFSLPLLPTTVKRGCLVEYEDSLCIIGYDRPQHFNCTPVFAIPIATIQTLSDAQLEQVTTADVAEEAEVTLIASVQCTDLQTLRPQTEQAATAAAEGAELLFSRACTDGAASQPIPISDEERSSPESSEESWRSSQAVNASVLDSPRLARCEGSASVERDLSTVAHSVQVSIGESYRTNHYVSTEERSIPVQCAGSPSFKHVARHPIPVSASTSHDVSTDVHPMTVCSDDSASMNHDVTTDLHPIPVCSDESASMNHDVTTDLHPVYVCSDESASMNHDVTTDLHPIPVCSDESASMTHDATTDLHPVYVCSDESASMNHDVTTDLHPIPVCSDESASMNHDVTTDLHPIPVCSDESASMTHDATTDLHPVYVCSDESASMNHDVTTDLHPIPVCSDESASMNHDVTTDLHPVYVCSDESASMTHGATTDLHPVHVCSDSSANTGHTTTTEEHPMTVHLGSSTGTHLCVAENGRDEEEDAERLPAGPGWSVSKIERVPYRACCPMVINDTLLVVGGVSLDGEIVGAVMVYDAVNSAWVEVAALQSPCCFVNLLAVDDGILCFGGSVRVANRGSRQLICSHDIELISFR